MEPNKSTSASHESAASWLASCGFLFPTNKIELFRFNLLYNSEDQHILGEQVDPIRIIRNEAENDKKSKETTSFHYQKKKYRLVANIKLKQLPPHIIEQISKRRDPNASNDTDKV